MDESKIIDAEKVFRWAELCVIPVRVEDIRRAHALGLFTPDSVPTIKPGDNEIWEAVIIEEVGQFIQSLIENGHYNIKTGRSTEPGYRLVAWTKHLEVVE